MATPIDFSFMDNPMNPMDMNQATDLSGKGAVMKALQDPNIWRFLAEAGSRVSQGQEIGQALGDPATAAFRRKAFQEAGAKQSEQQATTMQQLISALRGGGDISSFVGPKEDPNTADSITFADGGATVKVPTPQKKTPQAPLTDRPLEAITGESIQAPVGAPVTDARRRDELPGDALEALPFF